MPTASNNPALQNTAAGSHSGNFRWVICALLFFATTVNYVDRQVISILAPLLQEQFHWSEVDYSNIVFCFQLSYALMMLVAGSLIDRIGIRWGFAIAVIWWCMAAMGHALAGTVLAFMFWRFMLAAGEAANFPASIKTVAEWFPKNERALATSIFNSGTNIGAVVTPLVVAWILGSFGNENGWKMAFVFTGILGFLWLFVWLPIYRKPEEHPRLSKAELAYIQSEPAPPLKKMPWFPFFKLRQTWAFSIGKFLTDPIWWFFLFWLPKFFSSTFQLTVPQMRLPLAVIYTAASVGSIFAGYLPAIFLKRGWTPNAARKMAMLICALCVPPVIIASKTNNLWLAIALISLTCAAHQGWSANLFTLSSDMFPKQAVGTVVGIGGCAGGLGGLLLSKVVGQVLQKMGSYVPLFIIAAGAYLLALLIIQLLAPKLERAKIGE